jgi:hypothetical protein
VPYPAPARRSFPDFRVAPNSSQVSGISAHLVPGRFDNSIELGQLLGTRRQEERAHPEPPFQGECVRSGVNTCPAQGSPTPQAWSNKSAHLRKRVARTLHLESRERLENR